MMKSIFTFILLFNLSFAFAQSGEEMTLLSTIAPTDLGTDRPAPYNDVWGYTDCDGNEYALLGSATNVHFIDLRDPANPSEIARFAGGETTTWRDIKTYKDVAYAVSDNTSEGLMVFDLSDLPNSVTQVGQFTDVFIKAHNIYIDEAQGRLYVVGTGVERDGVIIYDLTCNPTQPELLASISTLPEGYIHDIYVRDNIAYASHGFSGFAVWDFNDVNNPIKLATLETGGYNHSSWVTDDGQYAVFAEEIPRGEPLGIVDLSEMMNGDIETVKEFAFPLLAPEFTDATPHNPYIRGNHIVSSFYEDGIHIYDISDPLNPVGVAYYDTYPDNESYAGYNGNWGAYPYLPSGNILASDRQYGLFVLSADNVNFSDVTPFNQVDVQTNLVDTTACIEEPVLLASVAEFDSYQWLFEGDPIDGATEATFMATGSGSYALEVTKGNCSGLSCEVVVGRYAVPADLNLAFDDNDNLIFPAGVSDFQWYRDGELVEGATESSFLPVNGRAFFATARDANGCLITSLEIIDVSNTENFTDNTTIKLYPTIVHNEVTVQIDNELSNEYQLQIFNVSGQLMQQQTVVNGRTFLSTEQLTVGIYFVHIFNENGRVVERIIKQ
ncbi:MAG: choice-of-anchor B family protein [Saprospiraceae bacterium]